MAATQVWFISSRSLNFYHQIITYHRLLLFFPASRRPLYYISSQEEEEVRKQEVKQRALLRRLYMDMEREQVKEYKKLKSHIDRIAQ